MCHVKCLVKLSPPPSSGNLIFLKKPAQKASVQLLVCYLNWNGISAYLYFLVVPLLPASLSHRSKFWTLRLLDDLYFGDGKLTFICCIFWICAVFGSSLDVTRSGSELTYFSSCWSTSGNS